MSFKRSNAFDGKSVIWAIAPTIGWQRINLSEFWQYRDLLFFFLLRDIKVRYKQTVLGFSWAFLQPMLSMIIFSIFLGGFAKIPSQGIPYPIFVYTALVPWIFFSQGIIQSTDSLISSNHLMKKVYFPRMVLPIAAVVSGFLDFILSFLILLVMMFLYKFYPGFNNFLFFSFLCLLVFAISLGVGIWLTALNIQFRDIHYIIPFLVQIWFFITPIVYPSSLLTKHWQLLYNINPMVGVVDGFRWALLGVGNFPGIGLGISTIMTIFILLTGITYFRQMEKKIADII